MNPKHASRAQRFRWTAGIFVGLLLVGTGASASWGHRHHHPTPPTTTTTTTGPTPTTTTTTSTTTTTTTSPASGSLAIGMSVPYFLGQSSSYLSSAMANMHSIGLRWIRVDADWSYIQPTSQSSFSWSTTDRVVNAATAAGMNVLLVIDDSPSWASSTGSGGTFTQPASAAAFAAFAAAVAAHYGPMGVHTFEIWNEENVHYFWLPSPNPSFYTSMLVAAYNAIKATEPGATVLSGGMAPSETSGGDYSPIDWLTDLYADGGGGHFDAVANHPYTFPQLPNDPGSNWSQMPTLHSIMVSHGDGAKQIWLTEFGAPSAGSGGVGTTGQTTQITQAVQDAETTPWIGALFIHTYQDQASSPDYFGLLNADGSAKPAWAALAGALG
jgi:polysaccharide biosynthesis protein PslG